jgi:glycosyltransferase involved in cell wall biosynthesis
MKKTVYFVGSQDFSKPNAPQNRMLAIARGLCELEVDVKWFLLASEIIESIKNDPHYSKINFIPIGNKKRICDNNKIWNYVYRLFLQYSLKFKIKAHLCGEEERALFSVGDSFIHLSILSDICKRNDILLFHERTEYPLLNIVSLPQKVNMFMYLNIFVPRCDHIFVISTALRDFFVMHLQKQSKDIQVSILNMIVEPDRYAQVTNTSYGDTKDIVYVGTPYGSKDGVYDLVEAFSLIMNDFPNARLIIVGDTSRPERMKKTLRLIDNLPDKDRVLLTGQLGREQVVKIINNAYCLTLARPANIQAKYGFPTKLGEYLATGRPVVITRVGDIPIYLKDGDNAFVAEPDNVYSFAERLAKCLNDSVNSQKIGEAGKYLIYKEFNYKSESNKILKSFSR